MNKRNKNIADMVNRWVLVVFKINNLEFRILGSLQYWPEKFKYFININNGNITFSVDDIWEVKEAENLIELTSKGSTVL